MKIVEANLDNLPILAELFDQYRVFYEKPSDIAGATQFLKARIEQKDSQIFLLLDGLGTGLGFTQLYPLWSSTRMGKLWLLNDLFMLPEVRGRGYSYLLLERAKKLARDTAAVGVMLETAKTNKIGNKLYPKAGFELDKRFNWYHWTNQ